MLGKDESGGREGRGFEPTSRLFSAERRVWFGRAGGAGCRLEIPHHPREEAEIGIERGRTVRL